MNKYTNFVLKFGYFKGFGDNVKKNKNTRAFLCDDLIVESKIMDDTLTSLLTKF